MKKIAALFGTLLLALFLAGCAQTPSGQPPGGNATGGSTVKISNFAFSPAELTVKKGTTVAWTNEDSVPHQIKSGTFNSQPLNKGDTFQFTFDNAGAFDYTCAIHPSMKGRIIVQ